MPFTLILVEEGQRFVDRTPIGPDQAIIGSHELTPSASGTQITHTIEIVGPDADHLAQEMEFKQEELAETVSNLARCVESDHQG